MKKSCRKKIVLIGCRGFVGSHLLQDLQSSGHSVTGISSDKINLTQQNAHQKLLKYFNKNTVVILVSSITPERDNSSGAFLKNIKIIENVSKALSKRQVAKIIYLSTVSVYGRKAKNFAIVENTPFMLDTHYALTKFYGEMILSEIANQHQIPLLILRLPRVYGANDQHSHYGPVAFMRQIIKKQPVIRYGNGEEKRAFLYVHDLSRIIELTLFDISSGIINVVPNQSYSFQKVLVTLKALNDHFEIIQRSRSGKNYHEIYNNKKFRELFSGFKFTTFKTGLKQTMKKLKMGVNHE